MRRSTPFCSAHLQHPVYYPLLHDTLNESSFMLRFVWNSGKSKWGLSNQGLKVLVTCPQLSRIACNCDHFAAKTSFTKGPKRPQMCTIAGDYARVPECGLKPAFESPHVDFPKKHKPCDSWVQCALSRHHAKPVWCGITSEATQKPSIRNRKFARTIRNSLSTTHESVGLRGKNGQKVHPSWN